jgi:hypothetical protein
MGMKGDTGADGVPGPTGSTGPQNVVSKLVGSTGISLSVNPWDPSIIGDTVIRTADNIGFYAVWPNDETTGTLIGSFWSTGNNGCWNSGTFSNGIFTVPTFGDGIYLCSFQLTTTGAATPFSAYIFRHSLGDAAITATTSMLPNSTLTTVSGSAAIKLNDADYIYLVTSPTSNTIAGYDGSGPLTYFSAIRMK